MRSWEQGFSEKERERNMIGTRRLIASTSSLPPPLVFYFTHSNLFALFSVFFFFFFLPLLCLFPALVLVCGVLMAGQRGDKADRLPDYSSLLCLHRIHLLHYSRGQSALNPASLLFTAFCPPELSSVRINVQYNNARAPKITPFIMQEASARAKTAVLFPCLCAALITSTKWEYDPPAKELLPLNPTGLYLYSSWSPDRAECFSCATVSASRCLNKKLLREGGKKN